MNNYCRTAEPSSYWSDISRFGLSFDGFLTARSLPSPSGTGENCNKRGFYIHATYKIFRPITWKKDRMYLSICTAQTLKLILRCFFDFFGIPRTVRKIWRNFDGVVWLVKSVSQGVWLAGCRGLASDACHLSRCTLHAEITERSSTVEARKNILYCWVPKI